MSCKHCKCAITEEVKQPNTTHKVLVSNHPTIILNIKEEVLKRIQEVAPHVSLNELLEEIIETFDYKS